VSNLQRRAALLADKIRKEGLVFAPWDDSSFRSLVCKDLGAGNYVSFYHDGGRVYITHEWLAAMKASHSSLHERRCVEVHSGMTHAAWASHITPEGSSFT